MVVTFTMKLYTVICFLIVLGLVKSQTSDPIVTVEQGKLKGAVLNLLDGSNYYSFKGIRYAQVLKRFTAPVPPSTHEGVYDATKHGPVCPQFDLSTQQFVEGDENCLFLNVYTRSLDPKAKLPVMVFIHGGSFMSGNGDTTYGFGPEFLIQHNVILVTLNYRLEALGFLCLDIPEVPGNAAMRDQVAALKWVQSNIVQFGGDPNKVTLFGESAGSVSVTYHIQSRMSKGLFNKAIGESGVDTLDYALGIEGKERAFRLAKYLGFDSRDTKQVLEFLRSVPAIRLTNVTYETQTEDEKRRSLAVRFAPVVEKRFKGSEPFITEDPTEALVSGHMSRMPFMLGYNSNEAIIMLSDALGKLNIINETPEYLVSREIVARVSEEKAKELGESIKNFYSGGDRDFTLNDTQEISNMLSDRYFVYGAHQFANFYSSLAQTYLYKFSYDTELNFVKLASGHTDLKGASHADELFYLFYSPLNSQAYNGNPELKDVVYRVTKLWTDFAKTGNPTPDNTLGVKWAPYTKSNRAYLDIDEIFTTGVDTEKARVDFWDKIYCDIGLPCIGGSSC